MGEAYRGLTIKIGAETTDFQKALSRMNSAISNTESLLRKVTKGLKFDGSNLALIETQMSLLSEKITDSSAKLSLMRQEFKNLGGTEELRRITSEHKNLSLEIENTKIEWNKAREALVPFNDDLRNIAKTFNITFKDGFDLKEFITQFNLLGQSVEESSEEFKEWQEAKVYVDQLMESTQDLRSEFTQLDSKLKSLEADQQFKRLDVEIKALEPEVASLVKEFTKLQTTKMIAEQSADGFKELENTMRLVDSASQSLGNEIEAINRALEIDPSNVTLLAKKEELAAEKAELLEKSLEVQNKQLDKLNTKGIDDAGKSMLELKQHTDGARQAVEKQTDVVAEIAVRYEEAKRNAELYEVALKDQKASLELIGKNLGEVETATKTIKEQQTKWQAEVEKTKLEYESQEAVLKDLVVQYTRATETERMRELKVSIENTTNSVRELSTNVEKTGINFGAIRDLATSFAATVGGAIMTAGYKIIDSANDIDSAFRDMKKTVNGTAEDFEYLRQKALEFSETHAVSADTILEIEAMGGQLGIAVSNLEAFSEVASNLDIATDINAETIAEQLGQLNNVMQLGEGDMERFGDALVRLGNNMPAQESAIMNIATRMASLGTIVGMSADEILAWSAAAASTGQGAEALGTNLSKLLSQIEAADGGFKAGTDSLDRFAEIAGMSAQEFSDAWNNAPSDAVKKFIEGLKRMDEAGESVDQTLVDLGITSVREKTAVEGLVQTIDTLDDAVAMSGDAWNGVADQWGDAGDAAREAAQKSEGFSGALQILENSAQNLGDAIGQKLAPTLGRIAKLVQGVTDAFNSLPDGIQNIIIFSGALGAVIGPVGRLFGQLAQTARQNNAEMKTLGEALSTTGSRFRTLGTNTSTATAEVKTFYGTAQVANKQLPSMNKNLKNIATNAKNAAMQSKALGTAFTALKGIGAATAVSLIVTGVMKLGSALSEARENTKMLNDSMTSFKSAGKDALDVAISSADGAKESFKSFKDEVRESAEKIIALKDELSNLETSTYANTQTMQTYLDQLSSAVKLYQESGEGREKIIDLQNQINSLTGEHTQLLDENGNLIMDNVTAIEERGRAWIVEAQEEAKAQAVTKLWQKYYELYAEQIEIINEIRQTWEDYYKALSEGADYTVLESYTKKIETLQGNLETITGQMEATKESINNVTEAFGGASSSIGNDVQGIIGAFNSMGIETTDELTELATQLANGGMNVSDFSSLTQEQMQGVVDAYNNGEGDISAALELINRYLNENKKVSAENADAVKGDLSTLGIEYDTYQKGTKKSLGEVATSWNTKLGEAGKYIQEHSDDVRKKLNIDLASEADHTVSSWTNSLKSNASKSKVDNAGWTLSGWLSSWLHFSLPDKGPLRELPKWPKDMALEYYKATKDQARLYEQSGQLIATSIANGEFSLGNNSGRTVNTNSNNTSYQFTGDIIVQAKDINEAQSAADVLDVLLNAQSLGTPVTQ